MNIIRPLKIILLLICFSIITQAELVFSASADTDLPEWLSQYDYIPSAKTVFTNITFDDLGLDEGSMLTSGTVAEDGQVQRSPLSVAANTYTVCKAEENTYITAQPDASTASVTKSLNVTPISKFNSAKTLVTSFKVKNPNDGKTSSGVRIYLKGSAAFTQYWERRDGTTTSNTETIASDGEKLGLAGSFITYMGGEIYTVGCKQKVATVDDKNDWIQFDIKMTWAEDGTNSNIVKVDYIAVNGKIVDSNITLRYLKSFSGTSVNFDKIGALGLTVSISKGAEVQPISFDDIVVYEPDDLNFDVVTDYRGFAVDMDNLNRNVVSMDLNVPCHIEEEGKIKVYENEIDITEGAELSQDGKNLKITLKSPIDDASDYRVSIEGLNSIYYDSIEKYEFTFTPKKYSISIPEIDVNDGIVNAMVNFDGEIPANGASLILATYNNGKINGFVRKPLESGNNVAQYSAEGADSAQAFVITNLFDLNLISQIQKVNIN